MAGIHRDFTSDLQIKAIEGYAVKYFPGWFAHWALPPYLWAHFGTHGTFAYLRKPTGSGHARERKFQASCRLCWLSAHHRLENIGSTLSPFGLPGLSSSLGSKRCTFLICRYFEPDYSVVLLTWNCSISPVPSYISFLINCLW